MKNHDMRDNRVLPDELATIIKMIGATLSTGSEGEGGLIFLGTIENALEEKGFTSEIFGDNYPNISNNIKLIIAIIFLYQITISKAKEFGIIFERPRYKRSNDGSIHPISIKEHLENLLNIWKKLIDDSQTGMPL